MSAEGFDNEHKIAEYLDGKKFSELNENMKRLIIALNNGKKIDEDTVIWSKPLGGLKKADMVVSFEKVTVGVSVKKGGGNSVHQEKIEFFISFIDRLGASEEVKNYLKEFIDSYEDGDVFFARYPEKRQVIQSFFNDHAEVLLKRFLKTGRQPDGYAEYIYHGTIHSGRFRKTNEIITEMASGPCMGKAVYVGGLTFQKWNTRNEEKRGSIQLKAPTLRNYLK